MTAKYAGLPDIEEGTRDIFETSDVESEPVSETVESANDDINTTEITTKNAQKRFENDVLEGFLGPVDFLGSVAAAGSGFQGYNVTKVDETPSQRLARISRELDELRTVYDANGASNDTENEMDRLVGVLETLNAGKTDQPLGVYNDRIRAVFDQISHHIQVENTPTEAGNAPAALSEPKRPSDAEILGLESRLTAIEGLVGAESVQELQRAPADARATRTIKHHLNDLTRRVNIVYNPEFELGTIKNEIKELNREAEKLATSRKLAQLTMQTGSAVVQTPSVRSTGFEAKVDALYTRLDEFDKVNSVVPHVLSRLKALHRVHSDMATSVDAVTTLDDTISGIKRDLLAWDLSVNALNAQVDEQSAVFEKNCATVEAQVAAMVSRIEKLENVP